MHPVKYYPHINHHSTFVSAFLDTPARQSTAVKFSIREIAKSHRSINGHHQISPVIQYNPNPSTPTKQQLIWHTRHSVYGLVSKKISTANLQQFLFILYTISTQSAIFSSILYVYNLILRLRQILLQSQAAMPQITTINPLI